MSEESQLIDQLNKSSYKAFNVLYEQYSDLLYGFVFGLTKSHGETKEIVQEAFIRIWIYREQVDSKQPFKAWLYKIAKNQVIDSMRKQIANPLFEDYLIHSANENLIVSAEDCTYDFDVFKQSLQKAKTKLSPRQVEIFDLCKEQGFTAKETAVLLNLSEQIVYNYLSQALAIIRKELSSYQLLLFMLFLE